MPDLDHTTTWHDVAAARQNEIEALLDELEGGARRRAILTAVAIVEGALLVVIGIAMWLA